MSLKTEFDCNKEELAQQKLHKVGNVFDARFFWLCNHTLCITNTWKYTILVMF